MRRLLALFSISCGGGGDPLIGRLVDLRTPTTPDEARDEGCFTVSESGGATLGPATLDPASTTLVSASEYVTEPGQIFDLVFLDGEIEQRFLEITLEENGWIEGDAPRWRPPALLAMDGSLSFELEAVHFSARLLVERGVAEQPSGITLRRATFVGHLTGSDLDAVRSTRAVEPDVWLEAGAPAPCGSGDPNLCNALSVCLLGEVEPPG